MRLTTLAVFTLLILAGCSEMYRRSPLEGIIQADTFMVHRRQSLIGEEMYTITENESSFTIASIQGENERGRISGTRAKMVFSSDFEPLYYENVKVTESDTANVLNVQLGPEGAVVSELFMDPFDVPGAPYFPLHSDIPAPMEMMLYHYYFSHGKPSTIKTLPRGEVAISFRTKDTLLLENKQVLLDRYTVKGINWGNRTIWVDASGNLIAVVYANTQFRELIRKGYEHALSDFVAWNVEEQMEKLSDYTDAVPAKEADVMAIVGGQVISGLREVPEQNMVVLIEHGMIVKIGKSGEVEIPEDALIIDAKGKTLIPGLWDMHAHANQVQWAPAYLAGGITTFRDCGNEKEFATAFRDAILDRRALGPDILLSGMVDGEGITGNGVVRARTLEEAVDVVKMYDELGYVQIKVYNGVEPEVLRAITEEAHRRGLTVSGHVPKKVGNARHAIALGMDHLNHRSLFLSILFPDETVSDLGRFFLANREVTDKQVNDATEILLRHKVVLDPTIALDAIRSISQNSPVEKVEPDAYRIARELFEGKRFQKGLSPEKHRLAQIEIEKSMEIIGRFHRAGVPIVAGTDNVIPVFSLYKEIEMYHFLGKFSKIDAIRSATIVPARSMGLGDVTGTLEPGKQADIAILDKNPLDDISNIRSVDAVMTNGRYYSCDALWKVADFLPREK